MLHFLAPRPGGRYCDGTVGGGGHAAAILEASGPDGLLLGVDRDPEVMAAAAGRLRPFGGRVRLAHGDYRDLAAAAADWAPFDGILLDLGVSSLHLDDPGRGFGFRQDGPLDMRFDRSAGGPTAADLLRRASQAELTAILREYGEERWAPRIARALVAARARQPLATTAELARAVAGAIPRRAWPPRTHPATRTFQALRIAVNRELDGLEEGLIRASALLAPGGRLVVISFHSLEDRAVKLAFRRLVRQGAAEPLTPKPVTPSAAEVAANPRSRSAKLRALRRRGGEGGGPQGGERG